MPKNKNTNLAADLQRAIESGKVNFKKSKYDQPELINTGNHKKKIANNTNPYSRHVFGVPVYSEPKMEYVEDMHQSGNKGVFRALAESFVQQQSQQLQKGTQNDTICNQKRKKDQTGDLIDDLFKSLEKKK